MNKEYYVIARLNSEDDGPDIEYYREDEYLSSKDANTRRFKTIKAAKGYIVYLKENYDIYKEDKFVIQKVTVKYKDV